MNHIPVVNDEQRAKYNGPTTSVDRAAPPAPEVKPAAKKAAAPAKPAAKKPASKAASQVARASRKK